MTEQVLYKNPTPATKIMTRPIRICYWNVWWRSDPTDVLNRLRQLQCDILCLQEVVVREDFDLPREISDSLQMGGSFLECRRTKSSRQGLLREGSAIFSRFPIVVDHKWLSRNTRAPFKNGLFDKRAVISAYLRLPGIVDMFSVGLAHLSYRLPFGIKRDALQQEYTNLRKFFASLDRSFDVFGGDLNSTGGIVNDISRWGCLARVEPYGKMKSWVGPPFLTRLVRQKTIDHTYVSPFINVVSARYSHAYPSDHRPLILEIQFL